MKPKQTMKRPKNITTLKTLEPFTADEIAVLSKAINTFSTGGHPMPDKRTIGGFSKSWVVGLLRKSETMLDALAKNPARDKDLRIVRQLLDRCTRKESKP
jgi:hypothetical protein